MFCSAAVHPHLACYPLYTSAAEYKPRRTYRRTSPRRWADRAPEWHRLLSLLAHSRDILFLELDHTIPCGHRRELPSCYTNLFLLFNDSTPIYYYLTVHTNHGHLFSSRHHPHCCACTSTGSEHDVDLPSCRRVGFSRNSGHPCDPNPASRIFNYGVDNYLTTA
jgi:hypothetical protein